MMWAAILAFAAKAGPVIAAIWSAIGEFARTRLGLAVICVGLVILFYEGLPLGVLRDVPWLGARLESLVDGRVDRARRAGAAEERAKWEEAARILRDEMEAKRRAAQAAIDAAEREYLASRQGDALKIEQLEAALAELEKTDEGDKAPACPDRPAIPGRVSGALDAIGR